MNSTKEAADRHVSAFNAKDLDRFVGNETEDIEFVIPGGIILHGRDQVRDYMRLLWKPSRTSPSPRPTRWSPPTRR